MNRHYYHYSYHKKSIDEQVKLDGCYFAIKFDANNADPVQAISVSSNIENKTLVRKVVEVLKESKEYSKVVK